MPGSYTLVDHSIFRAFNKGALGQLVVEGPEDKEIFPAKSATPFTSLEGGAIQTVPLSASEAARVEAGPAKAASKEDQIKLGKAVYESNCLACHQANGQGGRRIPAAGQVDYLAADTQTRHPCHLARRERQDYRQRQGIQQCDAGCGAQRQVLKR